MKKKLENIKTIYLSGKITGEENYKEKFAEAESKLTEMGYKVVNPSVISVFDFFTHEQFLHIDYSLIDCCDALFMLPDWQNSKGAIKEWHYAEAHGKTIIFQH